MLHSRLRCLASRSPLVRRSSRNGQRPRMHRTLGLLRVCAMPTSGRRPLGGVWSRSAWPSSRGCELISSPGRFHDPAMNVYRRFHRHAGRRRCQLRLRRRFLRGLLLDQGSREQRKPSTRTVCTLGATGGRAAALPRPRPGGARRSSSSDAWGHRSHRGHGGLGPARPGASSHFPRYSSSVCARREHRRSRPFARNSTT